MIRPAFSVYDVKAELSEVPFFHLNSATAVRYFAELCNREGHPYNNNPEDYSLWEIGCFDQAKRDLIGGVSKLLAEGSQQRNPNG